MTRIDSLAEESRGAESTVGSAALAVGAVGELEQMVVEMDAAAPAEIVAEMQIVREQLTSPSRGGGASADAVAASVWLVFDLLAYKQQFERVDQYVAEHCGISLFGEAPADTVAPTSPSSTESASVPPTETQGTSATRSGSLSGASGMVFVDCSTYELAVWDPELDILTETGLQLPTSTCGSSLTSTNLVPATDPYYEFRRSVTGSVQADSGDYVAVIYAMDDGAEWWITYPPDPDDAFRVEMDAETVGFLGNYWVVHRERITGESDWTYIVTEVGTLRYVVPDIGTVYSAAHDCEFNRLYLSESISGHLFPNESVVSPDGTRALAPCLNSAIYRLIETPGRSLLEMPAIGDQGYGQCPTCVSPVAWLNNNVVLYADFEIWDLDTDTRVSLLPDFSNRSVDGPISTPDGATVYFRSLGDDGEESLFAADPSLPGEQPRLVRDLAASQLPPDRSAVVGWAGSYCPSDYGVLVCEYGARPSLDPADLGLVPE